MSLRKHTSYNLIGAVLPIGLSLITIPIYISLIGESRYGVLAVAWLLLGYFGLFDLGLGRATAQRISALTNGKDTERAETFWTALSMNCALGALGALIAGPIAYYFFGNHFSVEAELRPELMTALPWLILAVPLATLTGVLTGALQGRSQFLELNVISVSGSALLQIFPLMVAWLYSPDLAWLLPVSIFTRLLVAAALFQRCYVHLLAGNYPKVSRKLAKELLKFGGWVTVSAVIGPMMVILDRFIIGAQMGAKFVTLYTVPFQLSERTGLIPIALSSALFPRLAKNSGGVEGQELAVRAVRSLAVVMTPLMLFGIFFMESFLSIWLGKHFADQATLLGQILLVGFWMNAFARIPHALLQASGHPNIVAKCHLAEVIPYFGALYLGLHFFSLEGVAVAFTLRTTADALLLLFFAGIFKQSVTLLLFPALMMLIGLMASILWGVEDLKWWIVITLICLLVVVWAFHLAPAELKSLVRRWLLIKI